MVERRVREKSESEGLSNGLFIYRDGEHERRNMMGVHGWGSDRECSKVRISLQFGDVQWAMDEWWVVELMREVRTVNGYEGEWAHALRGMLCHEMDRKECQAETLGPSGLSILDMPSVSKWQQLMIIVCQKECLTSLTSWKINLQNHSSRNTVLIINTVALIKLSAVSWDHENFLVGFKSRKFFFYWMTVYVTRTNERAAWLTLILQCSSTIWCLTLRGADDFLKAFSLWPIVFALLLFYVFNTVLSSFPPKAIHSCFSSTHPHTLFSPTCHL